MQQERKILAQFDKDKNKRLDLAERNAARAWLATQGNGGSGGGRRGGFGRGGFATPTPGRKLAPADVKSYGGNVSLYDPDTLRTIFLQFEEPDWEQALADFNNTDVDVPATAIVDGKTYKDVGVHFRGMSSYFMVPAGLKRSLNLSFDFAHDEPGAERLPHAQPAERQRRCDVPARRALLGDRPRLHPGPDA